MEITVLQGSPHKNGSSNMLADEFIRGAKEAGHTVTVLDVAHMNIHPCIGCGHCEMDSGCVYQDDNQVIQDALFRCDMVVFVTPVYYYGMSAQMKIVVDRFYSYTDRLIDRKLKAVLIAAAADDDEDVMSCIKKHYQKICSYMRFEDYGTILGIGCGTPEITGKTEYMQKAYQMGIFL